MNVRVKRFFFGMLDASQESAWDSQCLVTPAKLANPAHDAPACWGIHVQSILGGTPARKLHQAN